MDAPTITARKKRLFDGRFGDAIELDRHPNAVSTAWLEHIFDAVATVASVTIATRGAHGFGAAPQPVATLQVSADGRTYSPVVEIPPTRLDARTVTFLPVSGRRFRLTLRGDSAIAHFPRAPDDLLRALPISES